MKIGYDVSQTGNSKAGCGYFADSLIRFLVRLAPENEYMLYPHFGTSFWDPDIERTGVRIEAPNVSIKRIGRDFGGSMSFWAEPPDDAEERLGGPRIIHANNYSCPTGIKTARLVYTLYDLHFLEVPDLTTEENRSKCFEGVFSASIHADFVIAISSFSKDTFLKTFPHYPVDRMATVYLGSRFEGNPDGFGRSERNAGLHTDAFWLAVGTLEPRKNLRRLLRAFARYRTQGRLDYPLVLAGGSGWMEDDLDDFIRDLGLGESVRVLGYVTDEDLGWLYHNCYCFVYPSLYEGFGLPVLEAMSLGAPVITSKTTSLPEVGGDAAWYVDPYQEEELVQAFMKFETDEGYRAEMRRSALNQAKKFSWEVSALKVLEIYRRVISMPKFAS